jgi:hypothetical protein
MQKVDAVATALFITIMLQRRPALQKRRTRSLETGIT